VVDASILAGMALSVNDWVLDKSSFVAVAVSDDEEPEDTPLLEGVALASTD